MRSDIIDVLKKIYDLERLIGRVVYGSANARDLIAIKMSLMVLPELKALLEQVDNELICKLTANFEIIEDVAELIDKAITEEPPISVREGGMIKTGYNEEVDKLRFAGSNGKGFIAELEAKERERTGIKNLKIGFNKVFGYYIEVTKSYLSLVPAIYIRKQTLADKERYIIQELKEM